MEDLTGEKFRQRMDQKVRLQVFERDNYTCRYCGDRTGPFHADHVYPYSKGGETSIDNLVTACQSCNIHKQNKVGQWPKPLGHFEPKPRLNALAVFAITDLIIASVGASNGGGSFATLAFVVGIFMAIGALYVSLYGSDE